MRDMTGTQTGWSKMHEQILTGKKKGIILWSFCHLDSYNAITSKYGTDGVTFLGWSEYEILKRKAEMYDKIKQVYEEGGDNEGTITGDIQHLALPSLGGTSNVGGNEVNAGGKHKATDNNDENGSQASQDEGGSKRKPDDPTICKKILGRFEGEKEFGDNELENTTICPRCKIVQKT